MTDNCFRIFYKIIFLCVFCSVLVYAFPFSARRSNNVASAGGNPPIGTIDTNNRGKPEGENGFRQITKSECQQALKGWKKKLGVPSGSYEIEVFEMLNFLEQFAVLMPG